MSEASPVKVEGLTHAYGETAVFTDVSLAVGPGEVLAVLGASGSGKSTLLRAVAGFVAPLRGRVVIAGREVCVDGVERVRAEDRRVGMMFQDYALFPHYSVARNVAYGIHRQPDRDARVAQLLGWVGLGDLAARMPAELSGGQQQRVGVARALAGSPSILLLDEPFGSLDPLTRQRLQDSLVRIRHEVGLTAVFVTHDMVEALLLGDRIAVLNAGRLVQVGTPRELLTSPADDYVRQLMATPRRQAEVVDALMASGDDEDRP